MATNPVTSPLQGTIPIRTPLLNADGTVTYPWIKWFQSLLSTNFPTLPAFFSATHSTRLTTPAASYANGSLFYETDRNAWYIAVSGTWVWVAGLYSATQVQIPADLDTNDAGFEMNVTDYAHRLSWSGTQWGWAAGDIGSGYIVRFVIAPQAGWKACDGSSNVRYLKADGSFALTVVPVAAGNWFRQ